MSGQNMTKIRCKLLRFSAHAADVLEEQEPPVRKAKIRINDMIV